MTLTPDRSAAEDVLQDAFARVWASPNTPSDQTGFKRWLYRAILNLARDRARRQRRWSLLRPWVPSPADPLDEVERKADDAELALALRRLSTRERAAIHLRYFEEQSFAEAAETLELSEANARVIVHRALAKLRRSMGPVMAVDGMEA
jgi:RNA polymerase sigma-70 factor (ECF subfamily)